MAPSCRMPPPLPPVGGRCAVAITGLQVVVAGKKVPSCILSQVPSSQVATAPSSQEGGGGNGGLRSPSKSGWVEFTLGGWGGRWWSKLSHQVKTALWSELGQCTWWQCVHLLHGMAGSAVCMVEPGRQGQACRGVSPLSSSLPLLPPFPPSSSRLASFTTSISFLPSPCRHFPVALLQVCLFLWW